MHKLFFCGLGEVYDLLGLAFAVGEVEELLGLAVAFGLLLAIEELLGLAFAFGLPLELEALLGLDVAFAFAFGWAWGVEELGCLASGVLMSVALLLGLACTFATRAFLWAFGVGAFRTFAGLFFRGVVLGSFIGVRYANQRLRRLVGLTEMAVSYNLNNI